MASAFLRRESAMECLQSEEVVNVKFPKKSLKLRICSIRTNLAMSVGFAFTCSLRIKSISFAQYYSRVLQGENRSHSVRALLAFFRRKSFSFAQSSSRVVFGENRVHSVRALLVFFSDKIACISLEPFSYCFRRKSFSFAQSSSRVVFGKIVFILLERFSCSFRRKSF